MALFYFAYGSNMNPFRMRVRGVGFRSREPGRLPGYRLEFNKVPQDAPRGVGYANIVPDTRHVVEGALYEISEADLQKLDECEGYPDHYRREEVKVQRQDGSQVTATVYIANPEHVRSGLRPTREYLEHLWAGEDVLSEGYHAWLRRFPVFRQRGRRRAAGRWSRRAGARRRAS